MDEMMAMELAAADEQEAEREEAARQAEAQKPQKSKKWIVWVILLVVLLVGAGVAAAILQPWERKDTTGGQVADDTEKGENRPADAEGKVVTLNMNDARVQELWSQIKEISPWTKVYNSDGLLGNGDFSDKTKQMLALEKALRDNTGSFCKEDHELRIDPDPNTGSEGYTNKYQAGVVVCVPGDDVRAAAKAFFGDEIALAEGAGGIIWGDGYAYFEDGDEFVNVASGATMVDFKRKELYKAEMVGDKLALYEEITLACAEWIDGNEICPSDEEKAEKEGKFKWTFVKAEGGNYVFEKLEKME